MKAILIDYFRCPDEAFDVRCDDAGSGEPSFFRVNGDAIGFGPCAASAPTRDAAAELEDLAPKIRIEGRTCRLPFNLTEAADNLRLERYPAAASVGTSNGGSSSFVRKAYYAVRPLMPVQVRRHFQRAALRGWENIPFPRWPVDCSVDGMLREVMRRAAEANGGRVPFIWFWPRGQRACLMMSHDVETAAGRDFCGQLMDMNDRIGLKSSLHLIPEERYAIGDELLKTIRSRGFEIGVHGLNHDGNLFKSREIFMSRVGRINEYGRKWGARGFRSPVLYRNVDWFGEFEFEYDMTIPNTAHLDPQRGGCATVMPYFIGKILELPLTTIQDYPLFNILNDYSIRIWRQQIEKLIEWNGLISFNIHPDYLIPEKARGVYVELLDYLNTLRDHGVWFARAGEINDWWRKRARMRLVQRGGEWAIDGEGCEEAAIAWAVSENGRLKFELQSAAETKTGERMYG